MKISFLPQGLKTASTGRRNAFRSSCLLFDYSALVIFVSAERSTYSSGSAAKRWQKSPDKDFFAKLDRGCLILRQPRFLMIFGFFTCACFAAAAFCHLQPHARRRVGFCTAPLSKESDIGLVLKKENTGGDRCSQ